MSTINTKSSEFGERTLTINHNFGEGKSLLIGERDAEGKLRVLLDITTGPNRTVNIKATIQDNEEL